MSGAHASDLPSFRWWPTPPAEDASDPVLSRCPSTGGRSLPGCEWFQVRKRPPPTHAVLAGCIVPLFADPTTLPGRYRGEAGWGWAFRLQAPDKLMAVDADGTLYWATRTWRLRDQPPGLQHAVRDYFLIAQTEVRTDKEPELMQDIMNSLVRSLELREDGEELQTYTRSLIRRRAATRSGGRLSAFKPSSQRLPGFPKTPTTSCAPAAGGRGRPRRCAQPLISFWAASGRARSSC